jgi:hypothetical protein
MLMRVYRPAAWIAWFGGVHSVIFLCVFVGHAVVFSLIDPTPRGPWIDLVFVAAALSVYGTMTLLSLYLWAVGVTERIVVEGLSITFIGPIRKQTIHFRDMTRVRWRNNDSVKLYAGSRRQSMWFGGSRVEDAADLIKLIRHNVPAALQEGWHPFYQARMKGRYDNQERFRLVHPQAKRLPQPLKPGRLVAVSFGISLFAVLVFRALIEWQLSNVPTSPRSPLTGNWSLDCLLIGLLAPAPTLLIAATSLFRSRRLAALPTRPPSCT